MPKSAQLLLSLVGNSITHREHATLRGNDPPTSAVTGRRSSAELQGHTTEILQDLVRSSRSQRSVNALSIRRGSNPRSSPWQGDAVPLGY